MRYLAVVFGEFQQLILKARVGNIDQALDNIRVTLPAQVSHTVFSDNHIAQMFGDGGIAVKGHDIGLQLLAMATGTANTQDRPRARQIVGHGHKIVLPPYPADHCAILQRIGRHCAIQRDDHTGIDKTRVAPLRAIERVIQ